MSRGRRPLRRRALVALFAVGSGASGCGMLAGEGGEPGALPSGGTGLFRPLDHRETGLTSPPGRVIGLGPMAVGRGTVASGHLFYVAARPLADPPTRDPALDEREIDWARFETRTIQRAPARGDQGFVVGEVVLEPALTWEAGGVYDPFVLELPGGRVRLYYAAGGGLGVAEARAIDGDFARLAPDPIVAADGNPVRAPSVIARADGRYDLYYEHGGAIARAASEDGVTVDPGAVVLDVGHTDAEDVAVGSPGVVRVTTPTGRSLDRMYFEARFADGTRTLHLAAREAAGPFEVFPRPVVEETHATDPVPRILDARRTLLYFGVPYLEGEAQVRALVVAVSPATARLE